MTNNDIGWVCSPCGWTANYLTCLEKYGQPPQKASYNVSTYHNGTCDVCGQYTHITETRDFFYPDFSLLINLINKASKIYAQTTTNRSSS